MADADIGGIAVTAVSVCSRLLFLSREPALKMKFTVPTFLTLLLAASSAFAQSQPNEGFTQRVQAITSGEERSRQSSLWVMEVHLKPMRLLWVDMKDPETGETNPELFYYICYRAVNRPLVQPAIGDSDPVNRIDPEPGPPIFIPELTLVADDAETKQVFLDQIVPQAQAAINRKERRTYKNSVTIAGAVPEPTEAEPNDENAVYGVAIFRGVDPDYDHFTLYLSGFSNGYEVIEGPNGEDVMQRKTIVQKFWRPGDKFDPDSLEFRFQADPAWIFRPDAKARAEQNSDGQDGAEK
uniref:Uncharacterized protein n=2 Tax=Rubinisphaera brasiliensis TaxID=119 RepID=F0STC5_RUBBR|nr:hypothetical protein Plabr_2788 [Rubinisphaera brasiliensis DSM 5305]